MKINPGTLVVSKRVWLCLGLFTLLVTLPIMLSLPITYFPAISFPTILLASRATKQFRIDNGYDDDNAPRQ